MIKVILFDLDGVLMETKHLHYMALNRALDVYGYKITRLEHLQIYDGRPTQIKLDMLTENKGISKELHESIWKLKQNFTFDMIKEQIREDSRITQMLRRLKEQGYILGVCSNSIQESLYKFLESAKIKQYFDIILSNQDVEKPKPAPEIYILAMNSLKVNPNETLIVEDSPVGLRAAYESQAFVCSVRNSADCSFEKVMRKIKEVQS